MKKFIKRIGLVMAAFIAAFGFTFAPVAASAEEITETPEISAETSEIPTDSVTGEIVENSENEEDIETTFEGFLEWSKQEAEKYGYGNEYAAALEAIEAAASQEQVTLSTIGSFAVAIAVIVFIIVQKVKDKNFKKSLIEIAKDLQKQKEGTNNLIDGTNESAKTGEETNSEVKKTEAELQQLKRGMSSFISAFLRFTDGVKLGDNKKTEVQANCLNALKEIEGEVTSDESNEK